jgi:hypothetical protein
MSSARIPIASESFQTLGFKVKELQGSGISLFSEWRRILKHS